MAEVWKWTNLTLAFVMELVALAALSLWGWKTGGAVPVKLALAIGTPALAAVVWGAFAAPNATWHHPVLAILTKVVVFGGAAAGLWALRYHTAAVVFVAIVVVNLLIIRFGHMTP